MVYRNFKLNTVFRVVFLSVSVFLLFYSLKTDWKITPILVAVLILFQIFSLLRYVDRTNRELASFLESIRFAEFTRTFKIEGMGSSFDELNRAFNAVIKDFQQVRSEKEEHFHYLQSIVQNIDVSIIAFSRDGNVELINKAAKKLFQVNNLKNIKMLESLSPALVDILLHLNPADPKLVKVQDEDDILQLAINASELKIKDKVVILATIKNIDPIYIYKKCLITTDPSILKQHR